MASGAAGVDLDRRRPPMTTTTAMDAALLLDPPHIKRDQGIPPIKDWPGRPTNFHKRRWWPWPRAARAPAPPGPPEDAAAGLVSWGRQASSGSRSRVCRWTSPPRANRPAPDRATSYLTAAGYAL